MLKAAGLAESEFYHVALWESCSVTVTSSCTQREERSKDPCQAHSHLTPQISLDSQASSFSSLTPGQPF